MSIPIVRRKVIGMAMVSRNWDDAISWRLYVCLLCVPTLYFIPSLLHNIIYCYWAFMKLIPQLGVEPSKEHAHHLKRTLGDTGFCEQRQRLGLESSLGKN